MSPLHRHLVVSRVLACWIDKLGATAEDRMLVKTRVVVALHLQMPLIVVLLHFW